MKLLVKLTSRERPQQAAKCLQAMRELAFDLSNIQFLLTLDTDDPHLSKYLELDLHNVILDIGYSKNKVDAINRGTPKHGWDILVNVSDDQIAVMINWDKHIRDAMTEDLDASIWFQDGIQNRINTMEIIGRNYYNRFNWIYNPAYKSFFCDNESTETAKKLGKLKEFPFVLFLHQHRQSKHKTDSIDAVHVRAAKHWEEDKRTWEQNCQY